MMAKGMILMGAVIMLLGVIWYFFGDKLSFIGNLPGDIRMEKDNFKFYFPLTTMILFSIIVNILIRIVRMF